MAPVAIRACAVVLSLAAPSLVACDHTPSFASFRGSVRSCDDVDHGGSACVNVVVANLGNEAGDGMCIVRVFPREPPHPPGPTLATVRFEDVPAGGVVRFRRQVQVARRDVDDLGASCQPGGAM
jgi:hypothetical protein